MKSLASPFVLTTVLGFLGLAAPSPAAAQPEPTKPAAKESLAPAKPADAAKAKTPGDPYPLATCPITGKKLGSMGDPIVKTYDGREVRFCCGMCPPKFEKDLTKTIAKLDEAIVKDQLPLYPLDSSVVTGKKLPEKPIDWVYNNRLVRLADEAEKAEFQKDPAKHLAALDKATIEKQSKDYPLKTCPVSKDELGAMGEGKDLVIAGRLIRLCCASCEKDVRKDPVKFIAMIDEARKGAGGKKDDGHGEHHDHGK
ncbi:MAG: hypothetical protein JNM07_13490 [Phycisphaerae bacterium]|nr:hypothetical protein [Phycisphaerae bacterium]